MAAFKRGVPSDQISAGLSAPRRKVGIWVCGAPTYIHGHKSASRLMAVDVDNPRTFYDMWQCPRPFRPLGRKCCKYYDGDENMPEYLDLVDENDIIIGCESRNVIYQKKYRNYRVINVFIFRSNGKLIVPKRSMNRKLFSGCYDFSVSEHVISGENYQEAAYRGLREELGLQDVSLEKVGYFKPDDINTCSFSKLYRLVFDGGLYNYDKNGIENIYCMEIEEIKKIMEEYPHMFKDDFPKLFNWYLENF